jgi:bifunctional enzyme CysN/CysC
MHTVVVVGHVDHGKSTLLGRLLSETGHVRQDKIDHVQRICAAKGIDLEPAFFLDALEEEQAQGISIDTTSINFEYKGERFFLIDAPGHIDFLKNMASGASKADYGVLVIDAQEGIRAQTKRHLRVLGILGISNVIVALNKMDRVGYSQDDFDAVASAAREIISNENVNCVAVVPMSAFRGENVVNISAKMPWYTGKSLLELIYELCINSTTLESKEPAPFRMVLQDVYKFDDRRFFAGRVVSGEIRPGADVMFSPSGKVGRVASIEVMLSPVPAGGSPLSSGSVTVGVSPLAARTITLAEAGPGESIGIQLTEQLFVERGEVLSLPDQLPAVDTHLSARLVWMSSTNFDARANYLLKLGTKQVNCKVEVRGDGTDETPSGPIHTLVKGDFADVLIKAASPIAFDRTLKKEALNKLVLCTPYETVAAGVIDTRAAQPLRAITVDPNLQQEKGYVERKDREGRQKHRGTVLWLTGLSGAGKSTLAKQLERRLHDEGCQVVVLDGDNMRLGLCADLGFTPEDRAENVRRLAHVAKLMLNNGAICIVAVISPYERDRELASSIIGHDDFSEIFVFCPLELCQQRDPKGLYKRVAKGQIESFTGFDLPYQPPQKPDLRLDTSTITVEQEIEQVLDLLRRKQVIE